MDPIQLAQALTPYLITLLPYLLKAGDSAAEEAGKRIAGAAWDGTKLLWTKLMGHLPSKDATLLAADKAAASPVDADRLAAFRLQLTKVLESDPTLVQEIEAQWRELEPSASIVIAAGQRSVATSGSVHGSTIITGDQNTIKA